jgi:hypothetical protein
MYVHISKILWIWLKNKIKQSKKTRQREKPYPMILIQKINTITLWDTNKESRKNKQIKYIFLLSFYEVG